MSEYNERLELREEISRLTEEFLRKGGQIQQCPTQYTEHERKWLKFLKEETND